MSKISSLLFGELACCRNMQAAAVTGPSRFGGSPNKVEVAALSFYGTTRLARLSADSRM